MMKTSKILLMCFLGAVVMLAPTASSAQMSNKPFSFKFRGGAGEQVGISRAHKQLILERELLNRPAEDILIRDRFGSLLEVERRNSGQAFIRTQSSSFIPGAGRGGGFVTFGSPAGFRSGTGLGISGMSFGGGTSAVMSNWIMALNGYSGQSASQGSYNPSSTPINSWIGQLSNL